MILRWKYPASWWRNMWREALPSGNGKIGASVYGGVQEETIIINHADLWHGGRQDPLPDVSYTLSQTRQLMDEKRYLEASWRLTDELREQGYATRLSSRLPLAAVHLHMPAKQAFRQYERSLETDTGEVTVAWLDGEQRLWRKLFVSRADDCVVYMLASDQAKGISGSISIGMVPSDRWKDEPEFQALARSITVEADGPFVTYTGCHDDGTSFGAVMQVCVEDGDVSVSEQREAIRFERAERVLVKLQVYVGSRDPEQDVLALRRQLAALADDYDTLLERHVELHQPLIRAATLILGDEIRDVRDRDGHDLDDTDDEIRDDHDVDDADDGIHDDHDVDDRASKREDEGPVVEQLLLQAYDGEAPTKLVQLMWTYGRYLFVSGTAPDSQPFGLYGLWAGDYRLMWGHNMANENIQMMYWHAHVGGLGEMSHSLYQYYTDADMLQQFRENARKLYGCRGIYIPAGTTPGNGLPNQIVPVILNWTGAAGWLASHYVEHYRFTGDERFLNETVWPFLRETIAFYEDFLVVSDDGMVQIYPSVSPENTPMNHMPQEESLAHPMPTTINATMDIAILKELLEALVELAPIVGEELTEVEKWQSMLKRIPPYERNEAGAVREWMHPDFTDRYEHRHLSHLYPVFPGHEVNGEDDPELLRAFDTAVRLRKLGAQTGWSLAHMASIYARLGDGDQALECLDMLSRSCLLPNLWTAHNDWRHMGISMTIPTAPVQLDANMGWVNAVQEMLVYVSPRRVKLLPALPTKWKRGRIEDWRFTTGRVSMAWDVDAGRFEAQLSAERRTEITLVLPSQWEGGYTLEWVDYAADHEESYGISDEAHIQPLAAGQHSINVVIKPGIVLSVRRIEDKNGLV